MMPCPGSTVDHLLFTKSNCPDYFISMGGPSDKTKESMPCQVRVSPGAGHGFVKTCDQIPNPTDLQSKECEDLGPGNFAWSSNYFECRDVVLKTWIDVLGEPCPSSWSASGWNIGEVSVCGD